MPETVIEADKLLKQYRRGHHHVRALDGVSLSIAAGESVGIVGESGSGKSTLARIVLGLDDATSGDVRLLSEDLHQLGPAARRRLRQHIGVVFQEPHDQLDPQWSVQRIVAEPLRVQRGIAARRAREHVIERLASVALGPELIDRRPGTLSGGQAQRVAIARALTLEPKLLVLDEPTASLDMTTRAQILRLLARLRESMNLTVVFISHDLSSVRAISERVVVMLAGRVVESGPTATVLESPAHPYSELLLSAEMSLDQLDGLTEQGAQAGLSGERRTAAHLTRTPQERVVPVPGPAQATAGCPFAARCSLAEDRCHHAVPVATVGPAHEVACVRPLRASAVH